MATQYTAGLTTGQVLTAATMNSIGAAWESFTPSWSSSGTQPAIGNGSLTGKYCQIQKLVVAQIRLQIGSTTTIGSGTYRFNYPVTATNVFSYAALGTCAMWDNSVSQNFVATVVTNGSSTTNFQMAVTGAGGTDVAATVPFTWAANDRLSVEIVYEAA